jgi:hypothetical protein
MYALRASMTRESALCNFSGSRSAERSIELLDPLPHLIGVLLCTSILLIPRIQWEGAKWFCTTTSVA